MGIRRTNRPLSTVISGKGFRMVNRQSAVSATLVPLSSQTSSCHLLSSFVSIPILVRLSRTFQRSLPPPPPPSPSWRVARYSRVQHRSVRSKRAHVSPLICFSGGTRLLASRVGDSRSRSRARARAREMRVPITGSRVEFAGRSERGKAGLLGPLAVLDVTGDFIGA